MQLDTNTIKLMAVAAVVIGALIRLVKSDALNAALAKVGLPPVPKAALPWLAVGLGVLGGVVEAVRSGLPWHDGLVETLLGALAGTTAIAGHELVIESMRGGREILASKGNARGGGGMAAAVLVVGLPMAAAGCTPGSAQKIVKTTLDTTEVLCVLARSEWADNAAVMRACGIAEDLRPVVDQILGEQRAAIARAVAVHAPDTGGGGPGGRR